MDQLLQLRALYEMTTSIASKCFETCLPRLNPRLEETDKNCISNCAANFLHMKLLFTRRIVDAAQAIGHLDYTLADLDADFVGFSLHKWLCAPKGAGFLHVREVRANAVSIVPEPASTQLLSATFLGFCLLHRLESSATLPQVAR